MHSTILSAYAIGMSDLCPHSPTPSIHTPGTSTPRPPSLCTGIVILEQYLSCTGMVLLSIEVTREMQERLDTEVPVELHKSHLSIPMNTYTCAVPANLMSWSAQYDSQLIG